MRRIGVVVNPIAGMGGRVGLKGTDGQYEEAAALGADPRAPDRAREALEALAATEADVELLTVGGVMGEKAARAAGYEPNMVTDSPGELGETDSADTRAAVEALAEEDLDLLLFVGGDGTAVDVLEALETTEDDVPILGVPAGVKVYSGVFAVRPGAAGHVAGTFERTEEAEVNDVDEAAYREGEVRTTLRGIARVPVAEQRQSSKQLGGGSTEGLVAGIVEDLSPDRAYIFGPGSTVGAIERELEIDPSPLGVDVWHDGDLLVRDGSAEEILAAIVDRPATIVVSPIGGQGFVFGRGNQQLSPAVIDDADVEVVASRRKLDDMGVLRVDTGDPELDERLRGWERVRVGRVEHRLMEVV